MYDTCLIRCVENDATIAMQGTATLPGENPVAQKRIENKIYGDEGFLEYVSYVLYSWCDLTPDSGAHLVLRRHDGEDETSQDLSLKTTMREASDRKVCRHLWTCMLGTRGIWIKMLIMRGMDVTQRPGPRLCLHIEAIYRSASDPAGAFVKVVSH